MAEQPVFWLGGKPGTSKDANAPPEALKFEPAIRESCTAHGIAVEEFVAALGGFGSWLVQFTAGEGAIERKHRIVWNGREARLILQAALRQGGWEDLRECPIAGTDQPGFVAGIHTLMGGDRNMPV
jgi:hypothetical protein